MTSYTATSPLTLISAAELSKELLNSESPPLVLDACSGNQPQTVVPGAVLFPLAAIDVYDEDALGMPHQVSGNYSLKPPDALRSALESFGVTRGRRVVCYTQARKCGGLDTAVCCRLAWALCCAGVQNVALLVGGLAAWEAVGNLAAPSLPSPPQPVTDFLEGNHCLDDDDSYEDYGGCGDRALQAQKFPLRPKFAATTVEVEAAVAAAKLHHESTRLEKSGNGSGVDCDDRRHSTQAVPHSTHPQLADVRSHQEYRGGAHDYAFAMPRGRLPHACWAHWGPSTYVGGDFFAHDATGAMRPLEEIAALWRARGIEVHNSVSSSSSLSSPSDYSSPSSSLVSAVAPVPSDVRDGSGVASAELPLEINARSRQPEQSSTTPAASQERRLIFYCGSGWRSAVAWCVAQLLGHRNCANYDGGVLECSMLCPNAHRHALEGEELPACPAGWGDQKRQRKDITRPVA